MHYLLEALTSPIRQDHLILHETRADSVRAAEDAYLVLVRTGASVSRTVPLLCVTALNHVFWFVHTANQHLTHHLLAMEFNTCHDISGRTTPAERAFIQTRMRPR